MNEDKFTKLLRESMELERKIPFPKGDWPVLEQRLEQVNESSPKRWIVWWILPFLCLGILFFLQNQQLQNAQKELEKIKKEQAEQPIRIDTIFKNIEIQKVDTIYKTIIKEIPIKQDNKQKNKDLSFLKSIKTKELNLVKKDRKLAKTKIQSKLFNSTFSEFEKQETTINFPQPKTFFSKIIKENVFDDLVIQAALSVANENYKAFDYHIQIDHIIPPLLEIKEDIQYPFEVLNMSPPEDIFSVISEIGNELYQQDFAMREWQKKQRNISAQLDIAYYFPGKKIRPYIGLYAASDWQENTMITNRFHQMSLDVPWDLPPAIGLPPLSSITFRETAENVSSYQPVGVKYKNHVQSIVLHQVNLWYELNVGLQYNF